MYKELKVAYEITLKENGNLRRTVADLRAELAEVKRLADLVRQMAPNSALYRGKCGVWEYANQDEEWTSGPKKTVEAALRREGE